MIHNEKGFSLVQTMVAIGLTGVLGLIVMKNQDISSSIQTKNEANLGVEQATGVIQKALGNRAICSSSLFNKSASTDPVVTELVDAKVDERDYNKFIKTGGKIVDTAPDGKLLPGDVKVTNMKLIEEDGLDYLEVVFNLDPKDRKKMIGSKDIKKRFQLQVEKDLGKITTCYSESDNLVHSATLESCRSMGGEMIDGKCEFASSIVDTTEPVNCGPNATYKTEVVDGKIKLTCQPCTLKKKFVRWECSKDKFRGMNWVNVCYYKSGCEEDPQVGFGLEFFEAGPTRASGGDTGTKNNCQRRRRACAGEVPSSGGGSSSSSSEPVDESRPGDREQVEKLERMQ